jgi:hypothetical protein
MPVCFYFETNTEMASEKVVIAYEKRVNAEICIKEAMYDMAVGHLLLQSFWAIEAIFQLMMLTYNFLLFKMDFAKEPEYRQQIKTFRLKYIFLAGKIIRKARSVVMKLSARYPYQEIYEKKLFLKTHSFSCLNRFFVFKSGREKSVPIPNFMKSIDKNDAKWTKLC